ncbi:ABC transporter permease [Thiomicrorhabdus sp.]|uniref:ABC transporter permease n=1 Tax=Thiomicrorhabdus sp. TaxID=2039724 RepID=UPI0029C7C548|nr:ABC transporter permease [Thiomicrorhabdus sp.]
MSRYLFMRIAAVIPQLILISFLAFLIMKAAPGSPVSSLVGGREFMTAADYERVANNLGLNDPVPVQYLHWLEGVLHGDLGYSLKDGREVGEMMVVAVTNSAYLIVISGIGIVLVAVFFGYVAGKWAQSPLDYLISSFALLSFATPAFWLALLLILFFSIWLDWFPSSGMITLGQEDTLWSRVQHLFLPVLTIILVHVGPYIRLIRGSIRDVLTSDYYRAAVARGLPGKTLMWRYELPNSLTPFITWCGVSLPLLVGGTFIVEWVFSWPGLGQLFLKSAIGKNYPVLMAAVLVTGTIVVFGNLIADLLVVRFNPKLRRNNG